MPEAISDGSARELRAAWFRFVDTIEGVRPRLHAYCLRLSGSVWEAEDLVQDTLLRGFAAIGRGDLHGRPSRFDSPEAYLCQIATNLWIDRWRRSRLATGEPRETAPVHGGGPAVLTPAAGAALFARTSPQQRAAVVLKDVFDFSIGEIAAILATTPGSVKSALHRGRENLAQAPRPFPPRHTAASADLVDRFIVAFNARNVPAMVELLLEGATWEVLGVGGERGRDTIWLKVEHPPSVSAERRELDGELAVAFTFRAQGQTRLVGLIRIEEEAGRIARLINYGFCPDTIAYVAEQLGLEPRTMGYHQAARTLVNMIESSALPWLAD